MATAWSPTQRLSIRFHKQQQMEETLIMVWAGKKNLDDIIMKHSALSEWSLKQLWGFNNCS